MIVSTCTMWYTPCFGLPQNIWGCFGEPSLSSTEKQEKSVTLVSHHEELTQKQDELAVLQKEKANLETVQNQEKARFLSKEETLRNRIKEIEGEEGASWDEITEKCEKAGLEKDSIEEALTSLMDKGLIYEPILGTIKTT